MESVFGQVELDGIISNGQCITNTNTSSRDGEFETICSKIVLLADGSVAAVCSSSAKTHTILLTAASIQDLKNSVFASSLSVHGSVSQLVCGESHFLALTDDGNVYSGGSNLHGQIGRDSLTTTLEFAQVTDLAGINIVRIAASGFLSAAVSREGGLYIWGWTRLETLMVQGMENGVRGVADMLMLDFDVFDVALGWQHIIILTDDGVFYLGRIRETDEPVEQWTRVHVGFTPKRVWSGPCTAFIAG